MPQSVDELRRRLQEPNNRSPISPNAKKLARLAERAARLHQEDEAIDLLAKCLLFDGKGWDDEGEIGVEYLARRKPQFNTIYFPRKPQGIDGVRTSKQPRPDHALGYISNMNADVARVAAPFSLEEEDKMNHEALSIACYYPFMTVEWKRYLADAGHARAEIQVAKTGYCAVRAMEGLYGAAGVSYTPADTAHFSITVDGYLVRLWIHFRSIYKGKVAYYMEAVEEYFLKKLPEMENL